MNRARILSAMRRSLACFAFVVAAILCRAAASQRPNDLPKPTDYVSDFARVLSPRAVKEIDRVCAQLDHSTTDVQIAVVTIPSLNNADIAEYAKNLANAWGVGSAGSHRGVLVLLAANDHKWRIAVGIGLEKTLPNSMVASFGESMIPQLKANDFDDAIVLVVREIAQAVSPGVQTSAH
jgi:uncharacterized protein